MDAEKSYKRFAQKTIAYSFGVLVLIALITIIVDPFIHYHSPLFGLAACETDERGAMIGIAKNMDYDTALIGSSMSENFFESWFEDGVLGNKCVKLCMQGAHFDDFSRLFNVALSKPTTKRVVFSLDNYVLMNMPEQYPTTIPEYLENESLTDEAYYLWNKSVTLYYTPIFLLNNCLEHFNADTAYSWADDYVFDKYVARATYDPVRLIKKEDEMPFDSFYPYANQFLDSMIPYIESRPDVEFDIYVPPYSILYWDDCVLRGRLTAEICMQNMVFEKLLKYDNVRLFYFQDLFDITTDLNNYKDYSHYSRDINYYIYDSIKKGKHELTLENEFDVLYKFSEDATAYNYESAFH